MTSTIGVKKIQYPNGTNSITIDSSGSAAITTANITTAAITTANVTNVTATGTVNTPSINGGQIGGRRNLVINGAMQVAQRNTTQASIGGNTNYWTVDRHKLYAPNTAGRLTMTQDTDTPDGFGDSIKFDCTTADTSIAANEYMLLEQSFEGESLQLFKKGTSNAEQITVSFYMKTNKAFTFMCELNDFDNNRVNTQRFTTSTSWTRHILTFAADTTGALDNNIDRSFGLGIWMHAGSNFTGGTYVANAWQSRSASDNMRAVGIGSFFDNTDNLVRITGLQMEVGSQATAFEHRSFGEELTLCQRYYYQIGPYPSSSGYGILSHFSVADANSGFGIVTFNQTMRAAPAVSHSGDVNDYRLYVSNSNKPMTALPSISSGQTGNMAVIYAEFSGGTTAGQYGLLQTVNNNTDAFIGFSSEL